MFTLPKPKYEVIAKTYRNSHIYCVDAERLPSVTKILGIIGGAKMQALMIWARREALKLAENELFAAIEQEQPLTYDRVSEILKAADRQPDKVKDESADIGTRVHNAIDAYILGKEPVLDEESTIGFTNFLNWLSSEQIQLVAGDMPVASKRLGYGGRLDALGIDKAGNLIVLDWKTSNSLRDEYPLQVAAYAHAFKEMYGLEIKGATVVRFDKQDPNVFEAKKIDMTHALGAWLSAYALWRNMNTTLWKEQEQK